MKDNQFIKLYSDDESLIYTFVKPEAITINKGESKTFTLYFIKGVDDLIYLTLPSENNLYIYYKNFDMDYIVY